MRGMAECAKPDPAKPGRPISQRRVIATVGAGSTVTLPKAEGVVLRRGAWLGDSKHIVFTGDEPGRGKPRGYVQEIPAGAPRAFTPVGVILSPRAAVRNDITILGWTGTAWALYPIQGGEAQPVSALKRGDVPIQWSEDGESIYAVDGAAGAPWSAVDVFRIDLRSGTKVLWKTLSPSDPVGVETLRPTVLMTPDARSYCYSYMRRLGDLFVVDRLR
jgi:hypothetical protein